MGCENLSCDFVKAFITGGAFAAVITVVSYIQTRRRDFRDALFKAFDSYLKIMDYREAAIDKGMGKGSWEAWFHYYRAMFDLQWSEFYSWRAGSIPDKPYKIWLNLRLAQYRSTEKKMTINIEGESKDISYRIAWEKLLIESYFDEKDDFVAHMKHVHKNEMKKAMLMKSNGIFLR